MSPSDKEELQLGKPSLSEYTEHKESIGLGLKQGTPGIGIVGYYFCFKLLNPISQHPWMPLAQISILSIRFVQVSCLPFIIFSHFQQSLTAEFVDEKPVIENEKDGD